jgi:hypothetical protein
MPTAAGAVRTFQRGALERTVVHLDNKETDMTIGTILLIILILMLIGAIPAWPHSRSWGYGPTGGLGLVVIVVLVLLVTGTI